MIMCLEVVDFGFVFFRGRVGLICELIKLVCKVYGFVFED